MVTTYDSSTLSTLIGSSNVKTPSHDDRGFLLERLITLKLLKHKPLIHAQ